MPATCEIGPGKIISSMKSVWIKRVLISVSFTLAVLVIESDLWVSSPHAGSVSLEYQLQDRAENIKTVCQEHQHQLVWPDSSFRRNIKTHVWDFTHGLAYCPIAKVASTTWFLNFLEILKIDVQGLESMKGSRTMMTGESSFIKKGKRGKISKINFRSIVRNITAPDNWNFKELTKVLDVMTPFMLVRHPFTRLVSAYEDKMLNPKPLLEYHKTVQNEIKSRRGKAIEHKLIFPAHLLETEKYQLMLKRKITSIEELESQPSFDEFVSWLLKNRSDKSGTPESWKVDKSFSPFFSVCPVCQVDYSVIKLDGEGNEITSWINHLKLNLTSTEAHTEGGEPGSIERALDYFSQLTKDQVEGLYNIYSLDFMLFAYTPNIFIDAANGNLPQDKVSRVDELSKPLTNNLPPFNFGSLFPLKLSTNQERETSKKNINEEKKNIGIFTKSKNKTNVQN